MHPEKSVARILSILFMAFMAIVLTACGGGGGGGSSAPATQGIGGGGVKGPLANAIVTAYAFDATAAGFKGAVIDTGTTNANAKIAGLALTLPLAPPYILEFTSDGSTTDITTGMAPVITTMRTVLTQALLDNGEDIYATPLTTMATDLAVANADSNVAPFTGDASGTTSSAEFVAALPIAASQVASTLGFGIDSTIDIFDTPPLVDDTTDTTEEQTNVAAYRAAVEAVTAIVYEMDQQSSGTTPDSVLSELSSDLANDGLIDGVTETGASTVLSATTLEVLDQDPATLPIPNSDDGTGNPILVGDVEQVLIDETTTTGTTTTTAELDPTTGSIDTVVEPAETNPDIDGDGTLNANDAFPTDATEDTDTDGDGTGNNADTDDDNDGVADGADAFPLDATEHVDTDSDGTGNNADTDDDGDGTPDASDDFPLDSTKQNATDVDNDGWPTGQDPDDADDLNPGVGTPFTDTDGDGMANSGGAANDDDDDNDGVLDINDCAPLDPTKNVDTDGDTMCNDVDTDDDGDGTADTADAFPLDNTETTDTDGDGIGNNTDADDDNDGVSDTQEAIDGTDPLLRDTDSDGYFDGSDAFPTDGTEHVDTDGDTTGNNADTDDDNDGVLDTVEIANGTKPLIADTDGDGVGDATDDLPLDSTETVDTDGDGIGNNADTDDDGDGTVDASDAFPLDAAEDTDTDSDGTGNNADTDDDGDGTLDGADAFPLDATETLDTDSDGIGNNADTDDDGDGVADGSDAFPLDATESVDTDSDGTGNNADTDDDGDGVADGSDAFPLDATESVDTDGDGTGNNADTDDDNDGLSDTAEAGLGTNPLLADTDADTIGDATDNCPTVSNTDQADDNSNGIGNVCEATGATGVWKVTSTVSGLTDLITNGCLDHDPVSTVSDLYMTMTQAGTVLTAKTVWGDNLTGTIDNGTGVFNLAGTSTFTDPFTGDVDTDTISVSGTVTSATTWAGTVSITEGFQPFGGSNTNSCTETDTLASTFVYKHVAGGDYNGVYGLELEEENDGGKARNSFAIQFEVTGSTMAIHVPDMSPGETFTNTSFDPNTGFFSFDIDGVEDFDDGVGSEVWHDKLTGILVRAPGDVSGLPTVALAITGDSAEYDALGGTGNITFTDSFDEQGYGKRQSSTGFTRSGYFRSSSTGNDIEGIFMGMSHPPLKTASELYVEVLDSDGTTRLCTSPYSKRYTNADYKPAADMSVEAFQSEWYSFVSCNTSDYTGGVTTHQVTDGMSYTVRIMDMGADGLVSATSGGDDDTAVAGASMTVTAEVNTAFFTEKPSANDFALNGAAASKTMKQGTQDGVIELFGFFDFNDSMDFTWTGLTGMSSADSYTLQLKESKADIEQTRFKLTSPVGGTATETITIPGGTLNIWDGNVIRIRARQDGTTSNHRSLSTSKWIQIQPGIRGLFNVELGGIYPNVDTFQLWMDDGMNGTVSTLNDCTVTNNPLWTCNFGTVDYATNTVSLNMTDNRSVGSHGTVTMDLAFSDSANATVSSTGIPSLIPADTHVQLANPELIVRSLQPSGGVAQQSQVLLVNTLGAGAVAIGNIFDKAVFQRNDKGNLVVGSNLNTGITGKTFWCEDPDITNCATTKLFTDEVASFVKYAPYIDPVQTVGHYLSNRTGADWGLGLGLLDGAGGAGVKYKSVWTNSADPSLKFVFKKTYTAPNASVLVTPTLDQVTVKLAGGDVVAGVGVGDAANPVIVEPGFGLTWTGSVPTGGEWQIRTTFTSGEFAGIDFHSPWMTDAHAGLTENVDGTWTWVNIDGSPGVGPGESATVQIRARDGSAFTMLGAQRTGTIDDRVYVTGGP